MLFILFTAGPHRYLIAASSVAEVIPAVHWVPVAGAQDGVVGMINYRGAPVPLLDAAAMLNGETSLLRAAARTSLPMRTRILMVRTRAAKIVGVLVDRVLTTVRHDAHEFIAREPLASGAAYLGPVIPDSEGIMQRIDAEHLLPDAIPDAAPGVAPDIASAPIPDRI